MCVDKYVTPFRLWALVLPCPPPSLWALGLFCSPMILMIKTQHYHVFFLYILCKGNTSASTFVHFAYFFQNYNSSSYFDYYLKFFPPW
jgi:hypothetical protein